MNCPVYNCECGADCRDWETCWLRPRPPVLGIVLVAVVAIGGWVLALCTLGACVRGG